MADAKPSDLPTRAASAIAMVAVAGASLWLGGWFWTLFVAAIAAGVMWEWWGLVLRFVSSPAGRAGWVFGGLLYIGIAAFILDQLRHEPTVGWPMLAMILVGVVFTDIGAYFAGRTIGGPKIAPRISPSKTWAGLFGGILGAGVGVYLALLVLLTDRFGAEVGDAMRQQTGDASVMSMIQVPSLGGCLIIGAIIAVVAQAGDFFESWMKRRAGVKDSSKLIPGHGGLFDRADGMLAVSSLVGLLFVLSIVVHG